MKLSYWTAFEVQIGGVLLGAILSCLFATWWFLVGIAVGGLGGLLTIYLVSGKELEIANDKSSRSN